MQNQPDPRPRRRRRPRPKANTGAGRLSTILGIAGIAAAIFLVVFCLKLALSPEKTENPTISQDTTPSPTQPNQPKVVAEATILSHGDLLMHSYLFTSNPKYLAEAYQGEGSYNFDSIFQYVTPYVQGADYSVANLETTLGGTAQPYSGNPLFNCPDALADAAAAAGFDMLLTANNHCHDTGAAGLKRTLEQIRSRDLQALGTQLDDSEKKYLVQDIGGIQVGMLCFTYTSGLEADGSPNLNFDPATVVKEPGIVNYFSTQNLDAFYAQVQSLLDSMKADGAQATMLYIHWGSEYQTTENQVQQAMAQKLCDLGIDVIIGSHPHVVQPVDLLSSGTDPDHKTLVIYSLGNAVSNQRKEELQDSCPTGHTEDGVLFQVTFQMDELGQVRLSQVQLIPTWVNKFTNGNGRVEYNILPLEEAQQGSWESLFALTPGQLSACQASYQRTMAIVGPGLEKVNAYLAAP